MFKVIVAGSRSINNYDLVRDRLDKILKNKWTEDICILCGMAKGVDTLGEQYAIERRLYVKFFPADWDKHGNKAGYIRNVEIVKKLRDDNFMIKNYRVFDMAAWEIGKTNSSG